MNRHVVSTSKAPAAIGPYSQAIRANGFLFISGQVPVNPSTGLLEGSDIRTQARQVLDNLTSILDSEDLPLTSIVKVTIFLTDIKEFSTVNEVYGSYFSREPPARETVEVSALPLGSLLEISAIAAYPNH